MKTSDFKFALIAVSLLLIISSCSKEEDLSPVQPNTAIEKGTINDIDQLVPVTDVVELSVIEKASLNSEFMIMDKTLPDDCTSDIQLNEKTYSFYCTGQKENPFVKFLNSLNLSREQMIKLKAAMYDHQMCKKEIYMMIKRVHNEILEKVNVQRNELVRQYKAGEITERQLKAALEALHQRAQNALKEKLTQLNINDKLARCTRVFMERVKMILTAEQWQKWVAFHKKNNTTNPPTKK